MMGEAVVLGLAAVAVHLGLSETARCPRSKGQVDPSGAVRSGVELRRRQTAQHTHLHRPIL
jgi:hypothetical protein